VNAKKNRVQTNFSGWLRKQGAWPTKTQNRLPSGVQNHLLVNGKKRQTALAKHAEKPADKPVELDSFDFLHRDTSICWMLTALQG